MRLETWGGKAAALISLLTLLGMAGAGVNVYHSSFARAEDLEGLASTVKTQAIQEYEEQIREAEEERRDLIRKKGLTTDTAELAELDADIQDEVDRKARLLRYLNDLQAE